MRAYWGLDCTNWSGAANYEDAEVTGFDQTVSHDFKIVRKADEIAWYIDGQLMVTHTRDLPTVPATFLFNIWGTNKVTQGSLATPGVTRYMYIRNFSYKP